MQLKSASQPVPDSAQMTPETALQRAIYRAAHLGLGLTLDIAETRADCSDRDGVLQQVQPSDLIVRLEQDGEGTGVMVLDLDLVSALVEVQTLGCVLDRPASERAVTSTDAAVALPLIDGTLNGFEALLPHTGGDAAPGYHFGAWIRDPNLLAAQLADGAYDAITASVTIGTGDRRGRLFLALPVPPAPVPEPDQDEDAHASDSLSQEVMDAPARLDVVLYRMEMPLGEIGALQPGDVLTLPLRALSEVSLHAGERKPVATGVLGQLSGQRAVCIKNFGAGSSKQVVSPAQQAQAMAEVDLADPGLLTNTSLPATQVPEVVETADDILRDLGLNEGLPADQKGPAQLPAVNAVAENGGEPT